MPQPSKKSMALGQAMMSFWDLGVDMLALAEGTHEWKPGERESAFANHRARVDKWMEETKKLLIGVDR